MSEGCMMKIHGGPFDGQFKFIPQYADMFRIEEHIPERQVFRQHLHYIVTLVSDGNPYRFCHHESVNIDDLIERIRGKE